MKLEHLLQAYKTNNIEAEIKDMSNKEEKAGVISFTNGISASYLLDNEDIVVALKLFANCLAKEDFKINTQLTYTIKLLNIIQNTIMLIANIPQKECNMILDKLGLFDNTFVKRKTSKTFRTQL